MSMYGLPGSAVISVGGIIDSCSAAAWLVPCRGARGVFLFFPLFSSSSGGCGGGGGGGAGGGPAGGGGGASPPPPPKPRRYRASHSVASRNGSASRWLSLVVARLLREIRPACSR